MSHEPSSPAGLAARTLDAVEHGVIRVVGRTVEEGREPWLAAPCGTSTMEGETIYETVAGAEGLSIDADAVAGLIPDFERLRSPAFDPDAVHPKIRTFYEETTSYRFDVWAESYFPARPVIWLLNLFSRRMNQLYLPILGLEVSRGVTNEILALRDGETTVYRGWRRRLLKSDRVMYAGFYSAERPPGAPGPCIRVALPVPNGHLTGFMQPSVEEDGSMLLTSAGSAFGDPGFYRVSDGAGDTVHARYLKALQEEFHLYVDAESVLRVDHGIRYSGLPALKFHYRMNRVNEPP